MTINLTCIRGLPGSAKSTLATKLCLDFVKKYYNANVASFEADEFFMLTVATANQQTFEKKYLYQRDLTEYAHKLCQGKTANHLYQAITYKDPNVLVCVANTFTTNQEIAPYKKLAQILGINFSVVEPETEWRYDVDECFKRNVHNVPKDVIQKMKNRWEIYEE